MHKTKGTENLRAALQELARLGSPVDLSVADSDRENEELEITQIGGMCESSVFELPSGRVAYRMSLRLTNQTSRTIYSSEVELRTPWDDGLFDWLSPLDIPVRDRKKKNTSYRAYRFPGPLGLELQYDNVMNHVLLERGTLLPQRPLEGWLLAVGGRMPAELHHGQLLDVTLAIIGSDHTEYTQNICLWTERLETRPKPMEKRANLFEEPLDSSARNAVRVLSVESGVHDRSHLFQVPHRGARPVNDRGLRNQKVDLSSRSKEFPGLYGPGWRARETRVHQTIANTLESPTKEVPTRRQAG